MKKERKMRANDDREPLSEVPVPGMRAIEVCHTVENVELQEVELHQGPLENGVGINLNCNSQTEGTIFFLFLKNQINDIFFFIFFYLFVKNTINRRGDH